MLMFTFFFFFFSSRRRHTRWTGDWSSDVCSSDLSLVREPPDGVPRRWLWRLISFLSFHTLPPALRELYGVRHTLRHELALRAVCWTMRHDRPLMPPRWRFIAPALAAGARLRGENASVSGAGLFLRGAGWRVPRPRLDHAGSRQSR